MDLSYINLERINNNISIYLVDGTYKKWMFSFFQIIYILEIVCFLNIICNIFSYYVPFFL